MKIVSAIRFHPDEVEVFKRALPGGFDNALGMDEKGKQRVRSVRIRLTELVRPDDRMQETSVTEPFMPNDLRYMLGTLGELIDYLEPQMKLSWWEDQYQTKGLAHQPGLQGLADERKQNVGDLQSACSLLQDALGIVSHSVG